MDHHQIPTPDSDFLSIRTLPHDATQPRQTLKSHKEQRRYTERTYLPMATIKIEGQEFPIDDAIANGGKTTQESDRLLRDALSPTFGIAAGATFLRETRNDQLYITLVKQPGTKGGAQALQCLLEAPGSINPAMYLACEMHLLETRGAFDLPALLALQPRIDEALKRGEIEERRIETALYILGVAPAIASSDVPSGL